MIVAGILTPLENLLTWVLTHLHDSVGLTWAWSIVALVVIVRMLLVPLTVRQIHSMQNLQAHAPEMKAIQQKYKHDKQKMNQEMMAFYKENQINPAASCLPMLAQFPIFIGLFFVLKRLREGDHLLDDGSGVRSRVAAPDQHHRGHEGGLGPAPDRALRDQPADLVVSDVAEHAARSARDAARPADRLHPLRPQLSLRPDDLLADHEPVDDRPGLDHEAPDSEAATTTEEELADATEGRSGGRCRGAGGQAGRREEADRRSARPQGEAEEGRLAPLSEITVERTGETVGEAKWAALRELERMRPGLDKEAVRFQVVSEGERGLLGVGYEPARVIASVDEGSAPVRESHAPTAPRDGESADAARLREVVERIAYEIGVRCTVEIEETDDEIRVVCEGDELGMLIGRHGQTIDAIQYLANAIVFRGRYEERKPLIVDAAGYRDRRQATLDALAVRMAEQASATGQRVELEPMTAVERKIVHEKLKDDPEIETASEGTEPNRFVVIYPRHVDV